MDNEEQEGNDRRNRLMALAETLLRKRDEAVAFRAASGVERRWREDQQMFDALDEISKSSMIDYATGEAVSRADTGPARSRVLVNVLRGRVETAVGRFSDILLPVDDRNWGLRVTPVPDVVKAMGDMRPAVNTATGQPMVENGKPVTGSDIARAKTQAAEKAMTGMEDEIDDQLTECGFNGECRKVVRNAVKLGTGILRGPDVVKSVRKAWVPQEDGKVYVLETVENHEPASRSVSPWNVYPDPQCGEDVKRAAYIWEGDEILPREVRALIGLEGYFEDQLLAVLEEEPQRTQASLSRANRFEVTKQSLDKGNSYEKWLYNGDVDREDLEALGVDTGDLGGKSLSACVVFINDRPVKVQLNVIDTGDLPYDFFQWTQIDGSPWGVGVVREGMWQQRILIAAWRAMMDNARDSSGANVVIGQGVTPVDGKWELTGKKIWRCTGDVMDAQKAFSFFQVQNNQSDLQAIIDLALRFLDMETSLPMLFQGEQGELPETLGATNIMVDANNVALRTRVKLWDDQITRPHITRYYHWNMQYNESHEIKGDFNVDARGTSVLLARDQQARNLINVFSLKGDPRVDAEIDWGKAVRQLFEALKLDVSKSEEDKVRDQQNQKPPQNPQLEVAQVRVQGDLEKAKMVQASDMEELKFKAQESGQDRQHEMALKQLDYQIKMMEFAQQSGLSLQQIKKDLAVEASKQNLMRELADKKVETAQMTKPPVEPPQRAPVGQAYQQ